MFNDSTILITGATGFFGEKMIKALLEKYSPKRLIIFSRDEFKQYLMKQAFSQITKSECLDYCIGDIRDFNRLESALQGVDYVLHTASMKHIHIAEMNPTECIQTNIKGAENLIRACIKNKVKKVIGLSTDKAVRPANLYGATKLIMEKLFINADYTLQSEETTFSIVRFGNIIGSRGSVLPYFKRLIEAGSPELPITHPDMTRFWLPIKNAIKVVFEAFENGVGGEIFIPKSPSIKITDLARSLAEDLPTKVIGMSLGEKLHEILFTREDATLFETTHYYTLIQDTHRQKYKNSQRQAITGFDYSSNLNPHFLSVAEIEKMNSNDEYPKLICDNTSNRAQRNEQIANLDY